MQFGLQLTLEPEVQESLHSLQKALPSMHIPIQVRVPEADEEQLAKAEVVAATRPSLQDKEALVCHVNGLTPSPRVTLQLLENEDAASALLSLLPPAALAKVSLVCKSWRMAAEDERLWKAHCLNDAHCKSVMCSVKVLRLGGWRRFYCSRAKEVMLAKRLFPGKDQVTFFDIWMFTGEILWENLIEPTIQVIY